MKNHTLGQPNFRLFRNLRTLQGLDHLYCLRGIARVEFWDYDMWQTKKQRNVPIRDWTFTKDVNGQARKPKDIVARRLSQIRNLAPMTGPTPNEATMQAIERIVQSQPQITVQRAPSGHVIMPTDSPSSPPSSNSGSSTPSDDSDDSPPPVPPVSTHVGNSVNTPMVVDDSDDESNSSDDEGSDHEGDGSDDNGSDGGDSDDDGNGNNNDGDGDAAMPDVPSEPDTPPAPPNTTPRNTPQRSSRSASLFVRATTTSATDRGTSREAKHEDEQPNAVWRFPIDLTGDADTTTITNNGTSGQRESPLFIEDDDNSEVKPELIDLTNDDDEMDVDDTARTGYENDISTPDNNRSNVTGEEESLFVPERPPVVHESDDERLKWEDDIYDI